MISLSPTRFNALLSNLGQTVQRRKAVACPCRAENSNAGLPGCVVCQGKGIYWAIPVESYLGISGMQVQRHWAQFGSYEAGDVVVTVPSDADAYLLSDYDRILFLNSSQTFSQVFRKDVDDNPIPFAIQSIEDVTWLEPDPITLIQEVVTAMPTPTLDDDRTLDWTGCDTPPSGQYTLTGKRYAEYFVAPGSMVQLRQHHFGASLPHKAVLRRWEIFER